MDVHNREAKALKSDENEDRWGNEEGRKRKGKLAGGEGRKWNPVTANKSANVNEMPTDQT